MTNNTAQEKEEPLVSILMPAYNVEQFVLKSIQSIINQTYNNWELLICNDGSIDSSLKEINKINDPRITVFNFEKNQGVVKSRNILFSAAKGELITFQDADDLSMPSRIEKQVQFLKKNTT
jgi:teichuronic acid biosynthesis glycosyltransferase TuaG